LTFFHFLHPLNAPTAVKPLADHYDERFVEIAQHRRPLQPSRLYHRQQPFVKQQPAALGRPKAFFGPSTARPSNRLAWLFAGANADAILAHIWPAIPLQQPGMRPFQGCSYSLADGDVKVGQLLYCSRHRQLRNGGIDH
jgi:hypothetical protein